VPWQACLDRPGPLRENVEVCASHLGLGVHPQTLAIVLDRLAQAPGAWNRYGDARRAPGTAFAFRIGDDQASPTMALYVLVRRATAQFARRAQERFRPSSRRVAKVAPTSCADDRPSAFHHIGR
jgi:hypothetical protein